MNKRYSKEWYKENEGKTIRAGSNKCRVDFHRTETRQGSYERGLKWSSSKWCMLVRLSDFHVSMDHGKTWHFNSNEAYRKTKGKLKLDSHVTKEFAFDAIQKINREWEGPEFVWRP